MLIETLSCFAGIGGFSTAIKELEGFKISDAIEINPFRQKVLLKHSPELNIHEDIKEYHAEDREIDCLISTFPCRGFSYAGLRKGYENTESRLWYESYRIVLEHRPKFVVIENVRGFINNGLKDCLTHLKMAGYTVDGFQIISAQMLGAPHERQRVFVVAYDNRLKLQEKVSWDDQVSESLEKIRGGAIAYNYSEVESDPTNPGESLNDYSKGGWWDENPYKGAGIIPKNTLANRNARISALGDACTPHQAAVPLLRVQYLKSLIIEKRLSPVKMSAEDATLSAKIAAGLLPQTLKQSLVDQEWNKITAAAYKTYKEQYKIFVAKNKVSPPTKSSNRLEVERWVLPTPVASDNQHNSDRYVYKEKTAWRRKQKDINKRGHSLSLDDHLYHVEQLIPDDYHSCPTLREWMMGFSSDFSALAD